jgi:hypothetical protein
VSWVSRRRALVQQLPDSIQEQGRHGAIVAHAAAKYLVPLAPANRRACVELVEAIGSTRLSSRDMGILHDSYQTGNWVTCQRLLANPLVFLESYKEAQSSPGVEPAPGDTLLTDFEILNSTARRANRRLRRGILRSLPPPERDDPARCLRQSIHESNAWLSDSIRRWPMLDQSTRVAILELREQGHSIRGIARAMNLSRGAVPGSSAGFR